MNLLKVLLASLAIGLSLPFLIKGLDYTVARLTMSLSYLILAGYCYKYIIKLRPKKKGVFQVTRPYLAKEG